MTQKNQQTYEYIEFTDGMFGFEQNTKYIPIMLEENSDAVLLLQNIDNDELSFLVMNPFILYEDYDPILSDEDYNALGTRNDEELSYYVICVIKENIGESTVNLKCPIVVNVITRKARQVILESKDYKFRHYLKDFKKEEA